MNYPRGVRPSGGIGSNSKPRNRAAKATLRPSGTRSKYGAVRTVIGNRSFASKAEAARYVVLLARQKAGEISALSTHPSWPLHERYGAVIGRYEADFSYYTGEGRIGADGREDRTLPLRFVVEDVKGMTTLPLARWKQKHLKAEYGIEAQEIR